MSRTLNCFSNFILVENFFCINRCYLIDCPKKRAIGNIIFVLTSTCLISAGTNYVLTSTVSLGHRIFQTCLAVEFVDLVITARVRKLSFSALKRLDEKCGIDDNDLSELAANASTFTLISVVSAIIEVIGLRVIKCNTNEVIILSIVFAAQDTEMMFFSMIVEVINLRLSKLKDVSPNFGSKVYRHVLVTTALINEEFTPRIVLLLAVILGTTVTYSSVIMLSLTDTSFAVLIYLLWRELQALFRLWRVCYASWKSQRLCQQLAFHLAKTLALDSSVDKARNPKLYSTISRWYFTVLRERPKFVSGSVLSIDLSVPLHLLDISINYVLIIVQIYVAYK